MLSKVLQPVEAISNLIRQSWETRKTYRSWKDVGNAFLLRAAIGRRGARLLSRRTVEVKTSFRDDPILLRRHTSDFQIFMALFEQGTYDAVRNVKLPARPVVFDIGGNVGLATARFSRFFPTARFIVVEPDEENRAIMRANLRHLAAEDRVQYVEGFVSSADGESGIDRSGAASEIRMSADPNSAERIPTFSIPTLMKRFSISHIDLMKVDIEGAERELFRNCREWISDVANLFIEVDAPFTHAELIQMLRENGVETDVRWQRHSEMLLELKPVAKVASTHLAFSSELHIS